jgi:hypothetical protein
MHSRTAMARVMTEDHVTELSFARHFLVSRHDVVVGGARVLTIVLCTAPKKRNDSEMENFMSFVNTAATRAPNGLGTYEQESDVTVRKTMNFFYVLHHVLDIRLAS